MPETTEAPEAQETEDTSQPDPRDTELAQLRDRLAQLETRDRTREEMLDHLLVRPAEPAAPMPIPQKPDFSGMPDPVQDPAAYAAEHWARVEAFHNARAQAAPPKVESDEELLEALYSLDPSLREHPELAYGAARERAREIMAAGGNIQSSLARGTPTRVRELERMVDKAKMKIEKYVRPAAPPSRTAGTGGGNPTSTTTARPQPKVENSVETLKAIQKKRRLY